MEMAISLANNFLVLLDAMSIYILISEASPKVLCVCRYQIEVIKDSPCFLF